MAGHAKDAAKHPGKDPGAAGRRAVASAAAPRSAADLGGLTTLQRSAGNAAVALGIQRSPRAGGGRCACGGEAGPDGECAACRARRLAGLSVQRAPLSPATATAAAAPEGPVVAPGWLVEDGAEGIGPGQATKSVWLNELRLAICERADRELEGTPQSTEGCPFIGFWIGYFSGRAASEIGAAAVRYAPELAGVTNAGDAIPPIVDRVGAAVAIWVQTGQITGVPPGVGALGGGTMGGEGASAAGLGGAVQRKGMGGGGAASAGPAGGAASAGPAGPAGEAATRGPGAAAPSAANPSAILGRLGAGRPLDTGVRSRMEPLFSQDFSAVRVHDDHEASTLSTGLDAQAFTVGQHIALGSDADQPGTIAGDALLAHELAHVVQQAGAARTGAPVRDGTPAYEAFEQDADTSAAGVVATLWGGAKAAVAAGLAGAVPRMRAGLGVQRCKRTVYHCPKGKSWQQLPNPTGAGPVCICMWKCLPGDAGTHLPRSSNEGPTVRCPPGGCVDNTVHEEIGDDVVRVDKDGVTRDFTGDTKLAPGAHFTPLDGAPMCGCLPLDVEGKHTGTERTYTPMIQPSALELTDVFPGRAAKAMEQLEGRPSRGPGEIDPLPTKAPMTQEPPPAAKTTVKPPVVVEPPVAGKTPAVTPEPPANAPKPPPGKTTTTPEPPPKATTTPPAGGPSLAVEPPAAKTYTIKLSTFSKPTTLTDDALGAHMTTIRLNDAAVFARLESFRQAGPANGEISMGHMNILKGNIGELLSLPIQQSRLATVQQGKGMGGARIEHDIRIQLPDGKGGLESSKLFTDGMIVVERGGNLYVTDVFEVKAGRKGGSEATGQVFEWNEARLTDGATVILKDGRRYVYSPGAQGQGQIIGLLRAPRHLIAPKGSEHFGGKSADQIAVDPTRHALSVTPAELNYLARQAAETMTGANAPKPPAAPPTQAPTPGPTPTTTPNVGPTVIPGRRDDEPVPTK